MCGGELIYSEGTHDLCCARNPYESMSAEEWEAGAALHEGRAGYGEGAGEGEAGRLYIYKVWNEGEEGGRLKRSAGSSASIDVRCPLNPARSSSGGMEQDVEADVDVSRSFDAPRGRFAQDETVDKIHPDPPLRKEGIEKEGDNLRPPSEFSGASRVSGMRDTAPENGHVSREAAGQRGGFEGYAGGADNAQASDAPVKGHVKEMTVQNRVAEISSGENDQVNPSATPVKTHRCVFAVSFTESGRFGTLWSMRTVHAETNYFSLTRLMQKIEKRLRNGEPLAANAPNPPKKRERSAAAKLAFRFGIEEEDVYSIRYSTETVKRLALFYGISERDVRRIRDVEIGEE
jgi:hypothetical protein